MNWSARNTAHSLPGCSIRAATTARHARPLAVSRDFGAGANGIPYRRRKPMRDCALFSGVLPIDS